MAPGGPAAPEGLPASFGVVGVGTIASAVVRGLASEGGPSPTPQFVLSPRGAARAAALAEEFPGSVRVAGSNQEVVDSTQCVILAVLGPQADEVLSNLKFRPGQQVLSLVAALKLGRLRELIAPAEECAIAMPLPAVAKRSGATLTMPPQPFAKAIFSLLGSCVAVEQEAQFKRMQCITCLMGDFYKRQLTAQEWLVDSGVGKSEAASWVGAALATIAADSSAPEPDAFAHLVAEQTPGGLNEMVWREQEADGSYPSMRHSLDSVHHRLASGSADPALAPAAKRARTNGKA